MEHGHIIWYGDVEEGYERYYQAIARQPKAS
jgi:hypothetical protein